jgi:DNA (cytosine-5)-methyltransferase 1
MDQIFKTGLIVDNFAGGGGASLGIEQAMGRPVDIAVNHDPIAIAMHRVNHPDTQHLCESVWDVDPIKVCNGRPVALAWFSPDCKHFSKAKGGKPVEKKIRGLAWVVLRWANKKNPSRPLVLMLENVEEFLTWGPLVWKDGKQYPDPARKGQTFNTFVRALEKQGYKVEYKTLRACDYGAPTIRKRLFMIARCDGRPIVWPEPTHGDPASEAVQRGDMLPWKTAAECIEWDVPCPSIFERKRPLAEATQRRIAKGIMRYVVNSGDPFIVKYRTGSVGHSIKEPFHTLTAGGEPKRPSTGNVFGLVTPTLIQTGFGERKGQAPRVPGLQKPLGTVVAGGVKHGLVSAFLAKHYGGVVGTEIDKPAGTVTTKDHHAVVAANLVRNMGRSIGSDIYEPARTVVTKKKDALVTSHIVKMKGTNIGQDARTPLHTITAGGTHFGEVRAFLLKYYGTDQDPRLREPMHTITTKHRFGLVTVAGEEYQIADIGMRMLTPRELFRAQGFPDSYIIDHDADGNRITKTEQVAKCGNSVCPDLARVLIEANTKEASKDNKNNMTG